MADLDKDRQAVGQPEDSPDKKTFCKTGASASQHNPTGHVEADVADVSDDVPSPDEDVAGGSNTCKSTGSILSRILAFYEKYKAELALAVLLVYVITLAIATIIELIKH